MQSLRESKAMRARAEIVDNAGKKYRVKLASMDNWGTALVLDGPVRVAYAYFEVDDQRAHLADIKVYDRVPVRFLSLFTHRRNYQGRGIGSRLLQLVCAELSKVGVRVIDGQMHGDLKRLSVWYASQGFSVDGLLIERAL